MSVKGYLLYKIQRKMIKAGLGDSPFKCPSCGDRDCHELSDNPELVKCCSCGTEFSSKENKIGINKKAGTNLLLPILTSDVQDTIYCISDDYTGESLLESPDPKDLYDVLNEAQWFKELKDKSEKGDLHIVVREGEDRDAVADMDIETFLKEYKPKTSGSRKGFLLYSSLRKKSIESLDVSDISPLESMKLQYPEGTYVEDNFGHKGKVFDWKPNSKRLAIEDDEYGKIWIDFFDIKNIKTSSIKKNSDKKPRVAIFKYGPEEYKLFDISKEEFLWDQFRNIEAAQKYCKENGYSIASSCPVVQAVKLAAANLIEPRVLDNNFQKKLFKELSDAELTDENQIRQYLDESYFMSEASQDVILKDYYKKIDNGTLFDFIGASETKETQPKDFNKPETLINDKNHQSPETKNVVDDKKETTEEKEIEESIPAIETNKIADKDVQRGDVIKFEDELWACVGKTQSRKRLTFQNLISAQMFPYFVQGRELELVTQKEVEKVLSEIIDLNLDKNLPQIIQENYDYFYNKAASIIKQANIITVNELVSNLKALYPNYKELLNYYNANYASYLESLLDRYDVEGIRDLLEQAYESLPSGISLVDAPEGYKELLRSLEMIKYFHDIPTEFSTQVSDNADNSLETFTQDFLSEHGRNPGRDFFQSKTSGKLNLSEKFIECLTAWTNTNSLDEATETILHEFNESELWREDYIEMWLSDFDEAGGEGIEFDNDEQQEQVREDAERYINNILNSSKTSKIVKTGNYEEGDEMELGATVYFVSWPKKGYDDFYTDVQTQDIERQSYPDSGMEIFYVGGVGDRFTYSEEGWMPEGFERGKFESDKDIWPLDLGDWLNPIELEDNSYSWEKDDDDYKEDKVEEATEEDYKGVAQDAIGMFFSDNPEAVIKEALDYAGDITPDQTASLNQPSMGEDKIYNEDELYDAMVKVIEDKFKNKKTSKIEIVNDELTPDDLQEVFPEIDVFRLYKQWDEDLTPSEKQLYKNSFEEFVLLYSNVTINRPDENKMVATIKLSTNIEGEAQELYELIVESDLITKYTRSEYYNNVSDAEEIANNVIEEVEDNKFESYSDMSNWEEVKKKLKDKIIDGLT